MVVDLTVIMCGIRIVDRKDDVGRRRAGSCGDVEG